MNPPWVVTPHVGVGPVSFGMTREEVRAAILASSEEFKRTADCNPADYFRSIGVFTYYTDDGHLAAVELSGLQAIVVGGLNLTTTSVEQIIQDVLMVDPNAEIDANAAGFTSRILGVGVWTEGERRQSPQSIVIFANGYYD